MLKEGRRRKRALEVKGRSGKKRKRVGKVEEKGFKREGK